VTFENLNHSFLNFNLIAFRASQEAENEFENLGTNKKGAFLLNPSRNSGLSRGLKLLRLPSLPLKHRFLDRNKVAFWDGQEAENEFKVTCESLKLRFLDFIQVAF